MLDINAIIELEEILHDSDIEDNFDIDMEIEYYIMNGELEE